MPSGRTLLTDTARISAPFFICSAILSHSLLKLFVHAAIGRACVEGKVDIGLSEGWHVCGLGIVVDHDGSERSCKRAVLSGMTGYVGRWACP